MPLCLHPRRALKKPLSAQFLLTLKPKEKVRPSSNKPLLPSPRLLFLQKKNAAIREKFERSEVRVSVDERVPRDSLDPLNVLHFLGRAVLAGSPQRAFQVHTLPAKLERCPAAERYDSFPALHSFYSFYSHFLSRKRGFLGNLWGLRYCLPTSSLLCPFGRIECPFSYSNCEKAIRRGRLTDLRPDQ